VMLGGLLWQLGLELPTVLMRIGMVFFLGLYFNLTAVITLSLWAQEKLLYFQEHAAGCYGPFSFVLSRTLFDVLLMRVLPTVACAAVVYPMSGLSAVSCPAPYNASDPHSFPVGLIDCTDSAPTHAALFVGGLCLCNLVATTVALTLGIGCASAGVATLLCIAFGLLSMLFCGFLVNLPAIEQRAFQLTANHSISFGWLRWGSSLFYLNELVLSDEMLGHRCNNRDGCFTVLANLGGGIVKEEHLHGQEILSQLGYTLDCARVGGLSDTACWHDLCVPAAAVCTCLVASVLLLRFYVKDPH